MWQRARVVIPDPDAHGVLIWVRVPPERGKTMGLTRSGSLLNAGELEYATNIDSPPPPGFGLGSTLYIATDAVELLARGPEDFCNDPPRISWGAWADGGHDA